MHDYSSSPAAATSISSTTGSLYRNISTYASDDVARSLHTPDLFRTAASAASLHSDEASNDVVGYTAYDALYDAYDVTAVNLTMLLGNSGGDFDDTYNGTDVATNSTLNASADGGGGGVVIDSFISLNYSLPVMIVIATLLFILVILTAFGNFLVGLALFRFKHLRTVSNYMIGNLALSDFLLATTILPLSACNEALGHWVFGEYMCYFWLCIDVLYCTASI